MAKMEVYVHILCLLAQLKKRTTTNLKKPNKQNFQKIQLYGNLTTKELMKNSFIHPDR